MKQQMREVDVALLAHFHSAADADLLPPTWHSVLGEKPADAIARLIAGGLLETPSVIEQVAGGFSGEQLKGMAKARNLSLSGTKAKIATRLVEFDSAAMEESIRGRRLLVCSPMGMEIAIAYRERKRKGRAEAQLRCVQHLDAGEFREAAISMGEFESDQIFARGMGIDWTRYDPAGDVRRLEAIYSSVPGILRGIRPDVIPHVRRAAAMCLLWGTSRWTGIAKLPTGIRLGAETSARMFLSFARHKYELAAWKRNVFGVRIAARISSVGDSITCAACLGLRERLVAKEEVFELPHVDCTSLAGCRCGFMFFVPKAEDGKND